MIVFSRNQLWVQFHCTLDIWLKASTGMNFWGQIWKLHILFWYRAWPSRTPLPKIPTSTAWGHKYHRFCSVELVTVVVFKSSLLRCFLVVMEIALIDFRFKYYLDEDIAKVTSEDTKWNSGLRHEEAIFVKNWILMVATTFTYVAPSIILQVNPNENIARIILRYNRWY